MITNQLDENRIKQRISDIRNRIKLAAKKAGRSANEIKLMAVTKNVLPEYVNIAIGEGVRLLGENRAQELVSKHDFYDLDGVDIHFIGHLQRNKVKKIIDKVSMIESVDSEHLAEEISRCCLKIGMKMPILLEVNVGNEKTKSGFAVDEIFEAARIVSKMPGVAVKGLMAIPPKENVFNHFKKIWDIYIDISLKNIDNISMDFLSMGMRADFEQAIACGANIVRIGGLIFKDM